MAHLLEAVGKADRTGIWHETFLVRAGEYEAIYGNMPPYGLGKAADLVPLAESVERTPAPQGSGSRREGVRTTRTRATVRNKGAN